MHEFRLLDRHHFPPTGTLEDGIAFANRLEWNLTWAEHNGTWYVWGGEKEVLQTDLREVAEAFLYGIGLAYSALPDAVFQSLERNLKRVVEGEALEP
jgi:hypothetical protein